MAKNFDTITMDTALTNADKFLVGQADGDDRGVILGEVKRFVKQPLDANFKNGLIIPFYMYPGGAYDDANVNIIVDLKKANRDIPMIVIINPTSGPGAVTDGNYTAIINYFQAYGIHVVGYVSTGYRAQTTTQVKASIDGWKTYYPEISGIFFDEQSDGTTDLSAELAYYGEVAEYARQNGFDITITNPGVNTNNQFYDLVDIVVEHENSDYPTAAEARGPWPYCKQLFKRACLKHTSVNGELDGGDETDELRDVVMNYGWLYVTDDTLVNPWDSVDADMLADTVKAIRGELTDRPM